MGIPEGKISFGRPRCRWEDNSKINFKKVDYDVRTEWTLLKIETNGRLVSFS